MPTAALPPASLAHPAVVGPAAAAIAKTAPSDLAFYAGKQGADNTGSLVSAIRGVNQLNRGSMTDNQPLPRQTIYGVSSTGGSGALAITAYIFNEDFLKATPTNNGSGAGTVTETYNDGFNGNLLNELAQAYGTEGLPYKQIQLSANDNTTGLQDKNAVNAANPIRITYNGDTTTDGQIFPLATSGDPLYNQEGYLIINIDFRIRRFEQIAMTVLPNKTYSMILVPASA